jgi:hypothetical protein
VSVMPGAAAKLLATFGGMLIAFGEMPSIAVTVVEMVINVAIEMVTAVEPWTSAYEKAAVEPFRAVVAIRCAAVGWSFVVAVGTTWRRPNLDGHLSGSFVARGRQEECRPRKREQTYIFCDVHKFTFGVHVVNLGDYFFRLPSCVHLVFQNRSSLDG